LAFLATTASVIQVSAADLTPIKPGNLLAKYAGNMCLIVPTNNVYSRSLELDNIERWDKENNIALNRSNSKPVEIVITRISVLPVNHHRYQTLVVYIYHQDTWRYHLKQTVR